MKTWLALLLAVMSSSAASAADNPAAPAGPKTVVRFAMMSSTAVTWPGFVAQALGYYDREGLNVETTIVDPPTTFSALMGGSVDISLTDSTALVLAADKGSNIVGFGAGAARNPYQLMVPDSIKTIKDLKGKKIAAASPIEIYTTVIKTILKKGGLDPEKDVEWVFGGGQNQRLAAILAGAVQAGLYSPPADALLISRGFHSLAFTPDYYPSLQLSIQAVRRDWAQQHADVMRKYMRAQSDAIAWLYNPANKDRAISILAAATHSTPTAAATAYDYYIIKRGDPYPKNDCITTPGLQTLLGILHDQGRTQLGPKDVGKVIDTSWCPK